jgi:hypothetical protein
MVAQGVRLKWTLDKPTRAHLDQLAVGFIDAMIIGPNLTNIIQNAPRACMKPARQTVLTIHNRENKAT